MKIIEYRTAAADTSALLDKNVNALLTQGFEPYGSPYFSNITEGIASRPQLAQAMVKSGLLENSGPLEIKPQTTLAP